MKVKFIGLISVLLILGMFSVSGIYSQEKSGLSFRISFPQKLHDQSLDGRLLLLISSNDEAEPRFQIQDGPETQCAFGIEVKGLKPGEYADIDNTVFGYPVTSLSEIPPGKYHIQALINRYEIFHRSDGHTVKLPPDKGEGQHWNRKPGNLYSTVRTIHLDPRKDETITIELDRKIPPIEKPKDTKYIKNIRIKSKLLSEFWGCPMYLGAHVLLPYGFEEHPEARFPIAIMHGHFQNDFRGFRTTPPDDDLKPDFSERFQLKGYNKIQQKYAYKFYQDWISPDYPRMLIVDIQHANPYYDDSYAVNSANLGPYGDAITYELIPYIEKKFRGIGKGWSRFLYGGSTGGWEALAVQVFYPEEYNGCWAACPDPIDFRAYGIVNIYEDRNAYFLDSEWKQTPRPGHRNYLGKINATLEEMNHRELVLGTNSRSGCQWDIWQAVYSPVGEDGYPRPIWDKMSGKIDPKTAQYWKENYDLCHILKRDWKTLGLKLKGKIHIYCGDMDNYYLNNAVYLMEEFLENTTDPYYEGEVDYGDRAEHCWNGDHERPNAISRLRYHQMFAPRIVERILETAPEGADISSWRY